MKNTSFCLYINNYTRIFKIWIFFNQVIILLKLRRLISTFLEIHIRFGLPNLVEVHDEMLYNELRTISHKSEIHVDQVVIDKNYLLDL